MAAKGLVPSALGLVAIETAATAATFVRGWEGIAPDKELACVRDQVFENGVLIGCVQDLSTWVRVSHQGRTKDNRQVLRRHQVH